MFVKVLNTILLVLLLVMLGWGMRMTSLEEEVPSWLASGCISLLVLALVINVALIVARFFSRTPSLQYWVWLLVFFITGCLMFSSEHSLFSLQRISREVDLTTISFQDSQYQTDDGQQRARAFLQAVLDGKMPEVEQQCPSVFPVSSEPVAIAASLAIQYKRPQMLRYFLEQGLSPNSTVEGVPLLITAVNDSRLREVKLLLEAGAHVHLVDAQGNTALITAALVESEQIVDLLLDAGADPAVKNQDGYEAADYTRRARILESLDREASDEAPR